MSVIAVLLAVFSLLCAPFSTSVGMVLLVLAVTVAGKTLRTKPQRRVASGALLVSALAAGLLVFEVAERHRPSSDRAVDEATYDRPGKDRSVWLPLTAERYEVIALALLELEPGADELYEGFEPQIIERDEERGLRVIAYRHDGYTDFFDDFARSPDAELSSAVTGKGMKNYFRQDLGESTFTADENSDLNLAFTFVDPRGRNISVALREGANSDTVPLNILAPIGMPSAQPDSFPMFMINDMEFIRLNNLHTELTVDNRKVHLQNFPVPVPMQGQLRGWAKYSFDTEISDIFPAGDTAMTRVRTTGGRYDHAGTTYLFNTRALERLTLAGTEVVFEPPLDVAKKGRGKVVITSYPERGQVSGSSEVEAGKAGGANRLDLTIDAVDVPRQRGLFNKLIVNNRSVFASWPKDYSLTGQFD